jgi:hypothetical protein
LPTARKKPNSIQEDPRGLNVVVMTSLQNNKPRNRPIVGKNDYISVVLETRFWECSGMDDLPQPYLEKLCRTLDFTFLKFGNINM